VSGYLSDNEKKRFLVEIAESNEGGLSEAELEKAVNEFSELVILAGLVDNWLKGYMKLGWSIDAQQLMWTMTEEGKRMVQQMAQQ